MIGTSRKEYIFIRICIAALRVIAPISILYCIFWFIFPLPWTRQNRLPTACEVWFALEALFYLAVYVPLKEQSQRPAVHPETPSREERRAMYEKCMANLPEPETFLQKWFLDAPKEEIKRDNVKEWLRWGFFNRKEASLLLEDEVDEYVDGFEEKLGRKLEFGRGNANAFRLTFDKVDMMHRSLLWYLIVFIVDTYTCVVLMYNGFNFHRLPLLRPPISFPARPLLFARAVSPARTISYWHRHHTSRDRPPILFIHGIGIGLYPYLSFLSQLAQQDSTHDDEGQVGIIVLEIAPISGRLTTASASMPFLVEEIHTILKAHAYTSFLLVCNSYGTAITTNILRSPLFTTSTIGQGPSPASNGSLTPPLQITALLLIDPVTFLLHLPSVAYNFTKRKPRLANEYQLQYFASTDLCVAHTLARHFFWSQNILWKEDIEGPGIKVFICLAGRDLIVDTKTVWRYLTEGAEETVFEDGNVKVLWFADKDHAQVFEEKSSAGVLAELVRELGETNRD